MTSSFNDKKCASNILEKINVYFGGQNFYLEVPEIDLVCVELNKVRENIINQFSENYSKMKKCGFAFEGREKEVKVQIIKSSTKDIVEQLVKKAEGRMNKKVMEFLNEILAGREIKKFITEAEEDNFEEEIVKEQTISDKFKLIKDIEYEKIFKDVLKELKYNFVTIPVSDYKKIKEKVSKKIEDMSKQNVEVFETIKKGYEKVKDIASSATKTMKKVGWRLLKAEYKFKKSVRNLFATVEVNFGSVKEKMDIMIKSKDKPKEKYIHQELFEIEEYNFKFTEEETNYEFNSVEGFAVESDFEEEQAL